MCLSPQCKLIHCTYITWLFFFFGSVLACKSVSWTFENCINTKVKSHPTTSHSAPCVPTSSHVKTKHLPVYHLTIDALGGAGFESFEVNLSWEICITGAQYYHRLEINCLWCTTSNIFFRYYVTRWTFAMPLIPYIRTCTHTHAKIVNTICSHSCVAVKTNTHAQIFRHIIMSSVLKY